MFTYSEELYSDLHKDAYGFRPRGESYANWFKMTPEQKQRDWDYMCDLVQESELQRIALEAQALAEWRTDIARIMGTLNWSKKRAIRHDMESLEIDCSRGSYDVGFYCYKRGLAYGMQRYICRTLGVPY
jgi:hypothetical protein